MNRGIIREGQRAGKRREWRERRVKEGLNKYGLHRPELKKTKFLTTMKGEIRRVNV